MRYIVMPSRSPDFISDEEVKRRFQRYYIILKDGVVPVEGKVIGWKRTHSGSLGAIVLNELTGKRFLFALDHHTGNPRQLAELRG